MATNAPSTDAPSIDPLPSKHGFRGQQVARFETFAVAFAFRPTSVP